MELDPTANTLEALAVPEEDNATISDKAGLDQAMFLKIFLAQLQNQDPLNPQASSEMSSQLAQFSQLEQSVKSTDALTSIATKLDSLIELQGGGVSAALDPIGLIGKQISFVDNGMTAASDDELTFEITDPVTHLVLEAQDAAGNSLGFTTIAVGELDDGNATLPLPRGTYRLSFPAEAEPDPGNPRGPRPQLVMSDGTVFNLDFHDVEFDEATGQFTTGNPDDAIRFNASQGYRFEAIGMHPDTDPVTPGFAASATVTAVRLSDTGPMLTVGGREIPIGDIRRITQ